MYEAQTLGIIVRVNPEFMDQRSDPGKNEYLWSYTIEIENTGAQTVQLMTRYWRILDADGRQHVRFVDPKSIRQMEFEDPKIDFYKSIKDVEARLADPDLTLDSYILSDTSSADMEYRWKPVKKAQMLEHHVVFLYEDKEHYLETILTDKREDFHPQA